MKKISKIILVKLEVECETGECPVVGKFMVDSLSSSGNNVNLIKIYSFLYCNIFYHLKNYIHAKQLFQNSLHVIIVLLHHIETIRSTTHNSIFINKCKII